MLHKDGSRWMDFVHKCTTNSITRLASKHCYSRQHEMNIQGMSMSRHSALKLCWVLIVQANEMINTNERFAGLVRPNGKDASKWIQTELQPNGHMHPPINRVGAAAMRVANKDSWTSDNQCALHASTLCINVLRGLQAASMRTGQVHAMVLDCTRLSIIQWTSLPLPKITASAEYHFAMVRSTLLLFSTLFQYFKNDKKPIFWILNKE